MNATERIDIDQFSLEFEKVTEPVHLYLELGKNYLKYSGEYYGQILNNREDPSLGWKDTYEKFTIKIKKDMIVSLDMLWINKNSYYQIDIEASGYGEIIHIRFKKEKDAEVCYEKLNKFIFY